jgi:pimeloyl-ACP methyl ester carboxylesterase
MATPRRYTDKHYMNKIAPDIYGGAFRSTPSLIGRHSAAMHGVRNLGYLYQLLALAGWTSLPWLWSLPQPTLILMGKDDPLVPPINGHILAGLIPNAELRMIDDGHLFFVTRPAETAVVIEAFLADASKRVEPLSPLLRLANWVRGCGSVAGGRRDVLRRYAPPLE